jgi:hypothetical protein
VAGGTDIMTEVSRDAGDETAAQLTLWGI